ncbi:hypothetical protein [Pseudomonas sp. MH9.3]|uniref:hypothetical protein n=1 Tax=Pseudomonas sp. MH9.3 TaxID=3048630 RepID=UPI002AC9252A|nr:hypothetical protein [Pseudomonas sp. MH9.3]MEB0106737.1 hypothetical protein [Pseudomonas sp. MH9.3]WPX81224.1 hypothetical protein RHM60_08990 [Pseudomonas sp. MH9.3]WQG57083.1 hypothetical protein RHM66_17725 [Pseudomonas sp. RTB3]
MTSVNTQSQTPYTAGYEMSPNPAPIRREHSAEAAEYLAAPQDSTPPRSPMTAQQRGQFSGHSALVNTEQVKAAEPGQVTKLTLQNQALNEKFSALVARFESMIKGLQQQIADLTQQLEHPEKATRQTPFDSGSQVRSAAVERENLARTQDSTPVQQTPMQESPHTQSPQSLQTPGLGALSSQINQFYQQVDDALRKFAGLLMGLSQQIDGLFQKISGTGASPNDTPTMPVDNHMTTESDSMQPQAPAARQSEETLPATQPATSETRTIEELKRQNEQLNTHLDNAAQAYEQFIAQLQLKVDSLSQQVIQQKK